MLATLAPEVGADVTVKSGCDQFKGKILTANEKNLIIKMIRTQGTDSLMLIDRTDFFIFNNLGTASNAARKVIQDVM